MGDADGPEDQPRVHWSVPPPPPGSEHEAPAEALGEEFLFHLYRGSELLREDQFHEAQTELERAMSLQPREIEGQSLLGIVYFRLGHYPRAIQIYEELVRVRPAEIAPRINLALCHLKTAQLPQARALLEEIVQHRPDHARAWGYLGLVYQRLGDSEKAGIAFDRAGRPGLAARMRAATALEAEAPEETSSSGRIGAVQEIAHRHAQAAPSVPPPPSEPPEVAAPSRRPSGAWIVPGTRVSVPQTLKRATEDALLVFPERPRIVVHADGVVLVRVDRAFNARSDLVRAVLADSQTPLQAATLSRQGRAFAAMEPLGGISSPFLTYSGEGRLVLGAPPTLTAHVTALDGDPLYLREDRILGFDGSVVHEVGRLPVSDADFRSLVHFSGAGFVVCALSGTFHALEIVAERPGRVRIDHLLGWVGRLLPRPPPTDEPTAASQGTVVLSGNGVVLMDSG